MFLYHGTSGVAAERIRRDGAIRPRRLTRRTSHYSATSNMDAVYLTNAYAPYFAFNTTDPIEAGCAVFVIDTDKLIGLGRGELLPDEDALEQANRKLQFAKVKGDMTQRTRHFKAQHRFYANQGYDWRWSLNALGTCCFHGEIPMSTVVKQLVWTDKEVMGNIAINIFDPVISIANYRICGGDYRYLLQEMAQVDSGYPIPLSLAARTAYLNACRDVFKKGVTIL